MSKTINELIANAVLGAEGVEETASETVVPKATHVATAASSVGDDAEKLASVLELIGRRGVENMIKESSGSAPPPGTNMAQPTQGKVQKHSYQGPSKHSPPMKSAPTGKVESNAAAKPGHGAGSVDTSKTQQGDHHPALASNEAAINADKGIKGKLVAPAIKKALDVPAGSIHKAASDEHDISAIRAELARRAEAAKNQTSESQKAQIEERA